MQVLVASAALIFALLWSTAQADFNECLGVDLARLQLMPTCMLLAAACQAGVSKLNEQLHKTPSDVLHPVSIVSATASDAGSNSTLYAMLVQLAPMMKCFGTTKPNDPAVNLECSFDMAKMEMYSILATRQGLDWNLDGYKHHTMSKHERAQVVKQYRQGKFYGSNLALGIFDPKESEVDGVRDGNTTEFSADRTVLLPFLFIASTTVVIGVLFLQRRRLANGYAPIVLSKRGQVQRPKPHSFKRTTSMAVTEEDSLTTETNERFAV